MRELRQGKTAVFRANGAATVEKVKRGVCSTKVKLKGHKMRKYRNDGQLGEHEHMDDIVGVL